MTFVAERSDDTTEPTLAEMTLAAIKRLSQDEQGYYLLVEGGKIDLAHHEGKAGFALLETQEFFRAIEAALEQVDTSETLVIVTADHSHVFTIAGYPVRGNPILGLVTTNDVNGEPNSEPALAGDGVPFTTLGYTNGPGAIVGSNERGTPGTEIGSVQQSLYPLQWTKIDGSYSHSETHAGEDVALFALGPWAHLFGGVLEQNTIFDIIGFSFGWTAAEWRSGEDGRP
jgi:alkaline phosphatase